jgi:O-antigen ligase/polysaccharide polymerase Wzy-like membrane protein
MLWLERLFAIPGIALLVVFILARPQEFVSLLQRAPFLHIFTALAVLGYVIDVRLRRSQPLATNTLPWVIALLLWAIVTVAVNTPDLLVTRVLDMTILFALYAVIAHGIQRLRTLQLVAGIVATTCMFITVVCLHQGLSPQQCVGGEEEAEGAIEGVPDGRLCETTLDCQGPDAEPGLEYRCEHIGLFGTYSVDGRVRYRGELKDPNEVALTICAGAMALLIGFAMRQRQRSIAQLTYGLSVFVVIVTVFMTQSRGGLIALMLVPSVYLIRRYGVGVIIPGVLVAIPVMMLGGRSDANAIASTEMRYEAWATGLNMWHHSPIFGVGARDFSSHHYLTAHNSFVLTLAEMGIIGMFLFVAVLYLCLKTLIIGLREISGIPGAAAAEIWGMALLAAMAGILFQINTLSFAYHSVLWLFIGLVGAWYSAVRHHRPELVIKLTFQDVTILGAACFGYALVVLPLFLRYKGEM